MISVIVPVHNVKKYLGQCIESICCQTYKDLEIILVDDGSDDGSEKICDVLLGKKFVISPQSFYQVNHGQ